MMTPIMVAATPMAIVSTVSDRYSARLAVFGGNIFSSNCNP